MIFGDLTYVSFLGSILSLHLTNFGKMPQYLEFHAGSQFCLAFRISHEMSFESASTSSQLLAFTCTLVYQSSIVQRVKIYCTSLSSCERSDSFLCILCDARILLASKKYSKERFHYLQRGPRSLVGLPLQSNGCVFPNPLLSEFNIHGHLSFP